MSPARAPAALALCAGLVLALPAAAAPALVDGFESVDGWSARPADGVELTLRTEPGLAGNALRLDFDFVGGGGYAVVHKDLSLDLPANYRFRFAVRGECRPNNLEFKLIDSSGANVWWSNQRDFHFPAQWDSVSLKKRQIGFAWGPAGGGEIRHVAAIEFAVTAGGGGRGTVWLDQLTLEELPPAGAAPPAPRASASSSRPRHGPALAVDGAARTAWRSAPRDVRPWLALDLGEEREFGGLVLDWAPGLGAGSYAVEVSEDGAAWRTVREVHGGNGGRDYLYLPESEARCLRVRALAAPGGAGLGLSEITVEPLPWGTSLETFYAAIARDAPRGSYPRGISGEQSFWTVVGLDGSREKALLGEDGALETGKACYSVEPFLAAGGRLATWANVHAEQTLDGGYLPIPSVRWRWGTLALEVTAVASGDTAAPVVYARYRVRNLARQRARATLYLALRPFQVNPPAQSLNTPGGTATLASLALDGRVVHANGDRGVVSLTVPAGFGAAAFDQGDVTGFLRAGRLPPAKSVTDPFAHASGALAYALDLAPSGEREVDLLVPLREPPSAPPAGLTDKAAREEVERALAAARDAWHARTERVTIALPDSAMDVVETLKAQLADILVNRHGAALQPGSRSYDRTWIRDGALMGSALLRLGQADVVRDFLEWFAPFQYPDGKVPCCVDARGADPVPEHDSSGELIFLVAEYYRYTGDRGLVQRLWPAVARAAAYLDSLRHLERTEANRAPGRIQFYGLLPPSISHEGYSAKPMHSYWDDLFALCGFRDAVTLAEALGRSQDAARLDVARDEFQTDLAASLKAAMAAHAIDYLPGSADLGDFDATSTTIALDPVEADSVLPAGALARTFEKCWQFFTDRRDGRTSWDAFTPYELRAVGAFAELGWRERAQEALRYFLAYRRPPGWKQWAEVVWHDERAPHFIGDLPHSWVGSDYIRSVLDLLAYPRAADDALVVGAGVPAEWMAGPGVRVQGLPTPYGDLGFRLQAVGDSLEADVDEGVRIPEGGIVLRLATAAGRSATVDGEPAARSSAGDVVLDHVPARVRFGPPGRRE